MLIGGIVLLVASAIAYLSPVERTVVDETGKHHSVNANRELTTVKRVVLFLSWAGALVGLALIVLAFV